MTDAEPTELPPDVATMRYEAARDELVGIVRRLESGAAELEESLALWERGEALAARCQQVLDGALARLDAAGAAPGTASAAAPGPESGTAHGREP